PYKCFFFPVPSLADLPDSRLFVVITKKRIKLPHVSNAHCPHSSALYSSNSDITFAALFLHKQASSFTFCALLFIVDSPADHIADLSAHYLTDWQFATRWAVTSDTSPSLSSRIGTSLSALSHC
ncbi:hypothetical protein TYRP_010063, partial [Tyrophagus putrescentiae]